MRPSRGRRLAWSPSRARTRRSSRSRNESRPRFSRDEVRVNDLGPIGIWSRELRFGDPGEAREAAAELEELGFGTLWIPGGGGGDDLMRVVEDQLGETHTACFATGILNVFGHDPADVAREHARIDAAFPGRFLLGIGIGHAKFLDAHRAQRSQRPLEVISEYL